MATKATTAVSPRRVAHLVSEYIRILGIKAEDTTLTAPQLLTLLHVYVEQEMNQLAINEYTGVDRSAATKHVEKLGRARTAGGRAALLDTRQDPKDLRYNKVFITHAGIDLLEDVAVQVEPLVYGAVGDKTAMQH